MRESSTSMEITVVINIGQNNFGFEQSLRKQNQILQKHRMKTPDPKYSRRMKKISKKKPQNDRYALWQYIHRSFECQLLESLTFTRSEAVNNKRKKQRRQQKFYEIRRLFFADLPTLSTFTSKELQQELCLWILFESIVGYLQSISCSGHKSSYW